MHPILTIFCPFTREWAVERWLDNLVHVSHNPEWTNLCFIVDGDYPSIARKLKSFADAHNYRSFYIKVNDDWATNEIQQRIRRTRIAEVHNQSKDLIAATDGQIIIGLEDDTVFDRLESFKPLYQQLELPEVAFVEGVEMGRWGANMIGAWTADDPANPKEVKTLLPPPYQIPVPVELEIQDISAGGFYGYATRRDLYLQHEYYWSSNQPWGPDVNYGLWLSQNGHRCLINWNVIFGHADYDHIGYPDDPKFNLVEIVYNKRSDNGKWERTDHEQDRY